MDFALDALQAAGAEHSHARTEQGSNARHHPLLAFRFSYQTKAIIKCQNTKCDLKVHLGYTVRFPIFQGCYLISKSITFWCEK